MEKTGVFLTLVWFVLIGLILWFKWEDAAHLSLNEWGDFLAGIVSPLAFLWLIVGYNLQRKELKSNTEALLFQRDEMVKQAEELAEQNKHLADSASLARVQENQIKDKKMRDLQVARERTGGSPMQRRKVRLQKQMEG